MKLTCLNSCVSVLTHTFLFSLWILFIIGYSCKEKNTHFFVCAVIYRLERTAENMYVYVLL